MALDELTVDDFKSAVGTKFSLGEDYGSNVELEVVGAQEHTPEDAPEAEARKRAPFSVDLRGPLEPVLAQQTYPLVHSDLGTLEIFIVPVGVDAAGARYEATFA